MIGAILGDIAGSRFEFRNNRTKPEHLFTDDCFPTDDSYLTRAVAKALMRGKDIEQAVVQYSIYEYLTAPLTAGWGAGFARWCRQVIMENELDENFIPFEDGIELVYECNKSYGNGCAMKVSAVPYFATSEKNCTELVRQVLKPTHDSEEAYHAADCLVTSMWMALNGATRDMIKQNVLKYYPEVEGMTYSSLNKSYVYSELAAETLPAAMVCFLESKSFDGALEMAVSIGGDADTLGAITGALAESFYKWKKGQVNDMVEELFSSEWRDGGYDFAIDALADIGYNKLVK